MTSSQFKIEISTAYIYKVTLDSVYHSERTQINALRKAINFIILFKFEQILIISITYEKKRRRGPVNVRRCEVVCGPNGPSHREFHSQCY